MYIAISCMVVKNAVTKIELRFTLLFHNPLILLLRTTITVSHERRRT